MMVNPIDNGSRINTGIVGNAGRSQQSQASGKTGGGADSATPAGRADSASQSERLQQIRARIDNTPEVDTARVEAIKRAIAEGNYPLDPKRIAAKFAELEGMING